MPENKAVYSNATSIQRLNQAFANMERGKVSIPRRECPDVPKFIRAIQTAQEATRKNSIKFG